VTAYKIITTDAEAEALADEWRALHARAGNSIFTDYDWFHIWRNTVGKAEERMLHIIAGRDNGRLVGLLPLAVIKRKGFRILQTIGAEAFYYCDLLCEEPAQAKELWRTAKQSPYYDFAHIRDACPGSLCERTLAVFAHLREQSKNLTLRIDGWKNGEEWKATLSGSLRQGLNRKQRKLAEQGAVSYEVCRSEPIPEPIMEALVAHKKIWCEENVLKGMFDQPDILEYYRQMAHMAAQSKTLVLGWLKCGKAIIAYNLMFAYKKRLLMYVVAVDAAWHKYSPGNLAHVHAISWAIENGFEIFDFMQGDHAYKYHFTNQESPCNEYTFSNSLWGWLGEFIYVKRRMIKTYLFKTGPKFLKRKL
jgi:CelD/BcsL family acetyltransferase involved in cellulose biosynthesis